MTLRERLHDTPTTTTPQWHEWSRRVQKRRRTLNAGASAAARSSILFSPESYLRATVVSFAMEALEATPAETKLALAAGSARKPFRSRQSQRLRNHVAILKHIDRTILLGRTICAPDVIRWYTSISCGLSMNTLSVEATARLEELVRRASFPQLRLRPALHEIARTHAEILTDPIVPSFNGILSRLLLRYHMGRCALPPVTFNPAEDLATCAAETTLLPRLMQLIDESLAGVERTHSAT